MASVDVKAAVKGERVGEATLLVRYAGKFSTIPVTVLNPKPGFAWKPLPQYNYIDQQIDTKLERLKIQPSAAGRRRGIFEARVAGSHGTVAGARSCARICRRSGAFARQALEDDRPADRQSGLRGSLDRQVGRSAATSRKYLGEKGAYEFQQWIRDSVASNKPYDKLVHELLTSRGSSYDDPAANFFRVTREAKPTMEKTTQVFLGVRMVCAQCHDHPFERWTQTQYYQMAAFFSAVGLRAGYEVGEEIVFDQRSDYEMKHPKDGHVVKPEFMLALNQPLPVPGRSAASRRARAMAHIERQSVFRQGDRQPDLELLLRQGHHRPGG